MFAKRTTKVTIDGHEFVVTELTAKRGLEIGKLDGFDHTRALLLEQVTKPDGTAAFTAEQVDALPMHVVGQLIEAINGTNAIKN